MFQHSNCCNAGVYENTDVCMDCKEHCEVIQDEVVEWRVAPIKGAFEDMNRVIDQFNEATELFIKQLKEINNYQNSPVNVSDDGEETKNGKL